MAELTSEPTPTSLDGKPFEVRTELGHLLRGRRQTPAQAECVRQAHEYLGLLEQIDVEVGSESTVRRLLRTDTLERLARCEPPVGRRHRRLPRLVWRQRVAPTNADVTSPLPALAAGPAADACCARKPDAAGAALSSATDAKELPSSTAKPRAQASSDASIPVDRSRHAPSSGEARTRDGTAA
jgi:hypothetical protein